MRLQLKEKVPEETIEEMVRWLEREVDEDFAHFFPAAAASAETTAAEVPEQRVSEAGTESAK